MKNKRLKIFALLLCLCMLISTLGGCQELLNLFNKDDTPPSPPPIVLAEGEMSFHFMMLGNTNAGDCIFIKAGETDILIDAGSKIGSVPYIKEYIDQYVDDNTLEYVIATHAHEDHIDGFVSTSKISGIFDLYDCEVIIDFSNTNKEVYTASNNLTLYGKYLEARNAEVDAGAKHYTALECYNNQNGAQREYEFASGMSMEILYNYYYDHNSSDENEYSVCVMFKHGSKNFLFTGDLEGHGEEKLVEYNDLTQVELYKAGHHGSPTSSTDKLLEVIKPKMSVACCCAGSVEYTQNLENTFPSQAYIDRIAPYTDKVYVSVYVNLKFNESKNKYENDGEYLQLNGNIVVRSPQDEKDENDNPVVSDVVVTGSNNSIKLKDTEWFKSNRTTPTAWQN